MTPDQLSALVTRAYRDLGYEVITFRDGSKGVTRCPTKTINLMNRFSELILDALEKERERTESDLVKASRRVILEIPVAEAVKLPESAVRALTAMSTLLPDPVPEKGGDT